MSNHTAGGRPTSVVFTRKSNSTLGMNDCPEFWGVPQNISFYSRPLACLKIPAEVITNRQSLSKSIITPTTVYVMRQKDSNCLFCSHNCIHVYFFKSQGPLPFTPHVSTQRHCQQSDHHFVMPSSICCMFLLPSSLAQPSQPRALADLSIR